MNDVHWFRNIEDGLQAILTGNSEFFTVCLYDTDGNHKINETSFKDYSQAFDFAESFVYGNKPKNNKPRYVQISLD